MLQKRSWARSWAATSGVPCSHSHRTPLQGIGRQENGPAADRGADVKLWQAPRLAQPQPSATFSNLCHAAALSTALACVLPLQSHDGLWQLPPPAPVQAPRKAHQGLIIAGLHMQQWVRQGRARLHKRVHVFKKQVAMASLKRAGLWVGRGAGGGTAGAPPEQWGTASAGAHSVHALQCTGGWGTGGVTMLGCLTVPHVERRFQPVRYVMSGIRLTLVSTHPTCSRGPAGMTCRVALRRRERAVHSAPVTGARPHCLPQQPTCRKSGGRRRHAWAAHPGRTQACTWRGAKLAGSTSTAGSFHCEAWSVVVFGAI